MSFTSPTGTNDGPDGGEHARLDAAQYWIGSGRYDRAWNCLSYTPSPAGRLRFLLLVSRASIGSRLFDQAREAAGAAVAEFPDRWEPIEQMASVDVAVGTVTPATFALLQTALRLTPDEPQIHVTAGWAALAGEDRAGAEQHFRHADRLAPGHPGARDGLGRVLIERRYWPGNGIDLLPFGQKPENVPARTLGQGASLMVRMHVHAVVLGLIFILAGITLAGGFPALTAPAFFLGFCAYFLVSRVILTSRPKRHAPGLARYVFRVPLISFRQSALLALNLAATVALVMMVLPSTEEQTWPPLYAGLALIAVFTLVFWIPILAAHLKNRRSPARSLEDRSNIGTHGQDPVLPPAAASHPSGHLPTLLGGREARRPRRRLRIILVCAVTATSLTLGCLASAGLHAGAQVLLSGGSAPLPPKEFIQHDHDFAVFFPGTPEQTTVEGVFYDGSPLLTHYFDTRGPGSAETVSELPRRSRTVGPLKMRVYRK